ncbi:MAG TPA: LptF/LptG family permease, partial [Burkholderiales bacterium]|nr:LptF/LptG family permease [Burkholderiales bacterium]
LRRVTVLFEGYGAIVQALTTCVLSVPLATDDDRRVIIRTMAWSFTLTVAVTGLLMLPPLSIVESRLSSIFLAGLIPQAVPLAIPIALAFGMAFGMAGCTATRGIAKVILLTALLGSLISFVTLAWAMPAGNQAYRESIAQAEGLAGPLMKGPSEMTLHELDREATIAAAAGNIRRADGYAWSFHLRFALSAASVALVGFLLAAAVSRVATRALIAFSACVAYWALIYVGEALAVYSPIAPAFAGTIPVSAGAWLPNIVFVVAAVLIASLRSLRLRGSLSASP